MVHFLNIFINIDNILAMWKSYQKFLAALVLTYSFRADSFSPTYSERAFQSDWLRIINYCK